MGAVPLPTAPNTPWPPQGLAKLDRELREADAWWSGDPERLTQVYGDGQPTAASGPRRRFFWSGRRPNPNQPDRRVHVPLAGDIAQTGADLLFGEDVTFELPEGADTGTLDRLTELVEAGQLGARLLEAADVAGGLGGVFLRPTWDPLHSDDPILHAIAPNRAVPEFAWGNLAAVTFWRVLPSDNPAQVWRHLERHEPGLILHGLFVGDDKHLGVRRPLDAHPQTKGMDDEINLQAVLGVKALLPAYVPNVRPNRRHLDMPIGRPDTQGAETLLDSLDRTWSSWMRDIDLGKARLIVPDEFLDRGGRGEGAAFDPDREVFSPLNMDPAHATNAGITPVEFAIRTTEHAETAEKLIAQVIASAGYSPQTFGIAGAADTVTATEVRAREGASLRTTARKQRYWSPGVAHVAEMMLAIDRAIFRRPVTALRPRVIFAELAQEDPYRQAETLNLLAQARAASIETRVRLARPEWSQEEVDAEVAKIKADEGVVDDPTGGFV